MKRTNTKRADYILTGDWHIREDSPICFTGDWLAYQWATLAFIKELQETHNCPVLISGDVFHHWKPSIELLSETSIRIPNMAMAVYGNHDLPQHNMSLRHKSGLYNLIINDLVEDLEGIGGTGDVLIFGCSWNALPDRVYSAGEVFDDLIEYPFSKKKNPIKLNILVWHKMTYQNELPYPGCTDLKATKLLRKYNAYNLILTGDNHQSFVVNYDNRILVNPGCITIQDAGMVNHEPSVYLYYKKTNTVKRVKIPQDLAEISTEHLEVVKEKNERIETFISQLKSGWKVELDFEENLKRFQKKNKIKQSIMEIIYKSIDHEK